MQSLAGLSYTQGKAECGKLSGKGRVGGGGLVPRTDFRTDELETELG